MNWTPRWLEEMTKYGKQYRYFDATGKAVARIWQCTCRQHRGLFFLDAGPGRSSKHNTLEEAMGHAS